MSPEGAKETMPHTTTNLLVHFIFSTKQRCALLKPEFERDLHACLGYRPSNRRHCSLHQWHSRSGASPDSYVHQPLHRRNRSSDKNEFVEVGARALARTHLFAWQTGYGAFTVSEPGAAAVRACISNQQEHHKVRSFQEEFLVFLKKNGIVVDERYLWG